MRSGFIALFRVGLVAVLLGLPIAAIANAPDPELIGKRVALVIGNGDYGDLGALPNPPNDASDVAAKLRTLHFEVRLVTDGDDDAMEDALRAFSVDAAGADVALFYYAGHGMAVDGENYLVPVNMPLQDRLSLRKAIRFSDVRDTLESTSASLKMVILDACRDNPLAKRWQRGSGELGRSLNASPGLVETATGNASGWYIVYATAPGDVALDGENQRNSPFTQALLSHLGDENVDVQGIIRSVRADVLEATNHKQVPWENAALTGTYILNPVAVKPEVDPAQIAWRALRDSTSPAAFDEFLRAFPDSDYTNAAKYQLQQLRDPEREREAWRTVKATQDPAILESFLRDYPDGASADAARLALQGVLGAQLLASDDTHAMEAYIARFPDAPLAALIDQRMSTIGKQASVAPDKVVATAATQTTERALELVAAPTPPAGPSAAPEADLSPDSVARLRLQVQGIQIQYALKALGYYTGKVDGKLGPGSQRAISSFQRSIGAQATGDLSPEEIVALVGAAARGGNRDAQTIYGVLFQTGAGVKKDQARAVEWYRRAAEGGNGYGQLNLGFAYANGWGVERDVVSARRWLEAANASGVPEARQALRTLGD